MKDETEYCYLLTIRNSDGTHIYSLRDKNKEPEILLFECEDDAKRYKMMMEQDDEYVVGETMEMEITEVEYDSFLEIAKTRGRKYILVKNDELFIPPTTS